MNWNEHTISSFCKTSSGGTPSRSKPEYYDGLIPWIKSGELREDVILSSAEHITEKSLADSSAKMIDEGALLVAMYGATIGRVAYLGVPAATNQAICNIVPDVAKADRKFLFYALRSKASEWIHRGAGGAQPNISQKIIQETKIPLPPLEEQRRIAAILDKADVIRKKRKKAIELTETFLRSVFLDMFGDPVTNPKGWPVVQLDRLARKVTDGTHHSPPVIDKGVPYITAKHLKKHGLDFEAAPWFISLESHQAIYSRCDPKKGDVLYIKDGATTGLAAINNYDFEFSMLSSLALIKADQENLLSEYLCDWLNNSSVKDRILQNLSGAAITRLTIRKIKDIQIELPPVSVQHEYLLVRKRNESLLCRQRNKLKIADDLFNALVQKAFRGELTQEAEKLMAVEA